MSHTDNTAKKFDTNIPEWLVLKLNIRYMEPVLSASRQAQKRQWKREIEMELSA